MQFTIVSGTNRPGNLSLKVASICHQMLSDAGLDASLVDLADLPRDIAFDYLGDSKSFASFQKIVDDSTHFVFVVPEYNASIPGILKLFIDACSYPESFKGKHVALIGIAAGELGNEPGIRHMDEIMRCFGAEVCEGQVLLANIRKNLLPDGQFGPQFPSAEIEAQFSTWLQKKIGVNS